jgi:hypothetical protein
MSRGWLAKTVAIAAAVILLFGGTFYFARPNRAGAPVRISERGTTATAPLFKTALLTDAGDRFFGNTGGDLTLHVSKVELASLQPSLLSINRAILAERYYADQGLPLDLPIRQILSETATPAMP